MGTKLSISYSKRKSLEKNNIFLHLYSELNDLDTALNGDPQSTGTLRKREQVKLKPNRSDEITRHNV